jgi:hypothetical protein
MIDLDALDRAANEENARRAAERAASGETPNQVGQEPQDPHGTTVEQTAPQEQTPVQAGQESPVPMRCPEPKVDSDANGLIWPEPEPEAPKTVGGGAILDGDDAPAPEAISWPEPAAPEPEPEKAPEAQPEPELPEAQPEPQAVQAPKAKKKSAKKTAAPEWPDDPS